jgi:dTDP-4-amino-4,6-dideoxygalactose transaminase
MRTAAPRATSSAHGMPDRLRTEFLPFHVPHIDEAEIQAVVATLRSGWLTSGPQVKAFERSFAELIGVPHAVAVNSGTAALHLALEAVGVAEGDEVIIPTMTFAATAEVVTYLKAKPILVDCQPDTLNIDPSLIERAITHRCKAIIPVHFGGQPCEMETILTIARRHGLKVIEDAAHALPARYGGQLVGTLGDITCFSFYATKTITTGEGGMITTSNDQYAERMRMMSLHGISKDAWKRYTAEGSWYYEVLFPGYKYNLTDIAAAIGIEQLKKCAWFWERRQHIAATYDRAFADLPEIIRPSCRKDVQHAWHLYVIQLELARLQKSRNDFIEALRNRRIGTSVHFIPLHLHPYYREVCGYVASDFPVATAVSQQIVSLPIYPNMTTADVEDVIANVRTIVEQCRS